MKKVLLLALILLLVSMAFIGCGNDDDGTDEDENVGAVSDADEEEAADDDEEAEADDEDEAEADDENEEMTEGSVALLGLGQKISIGRSRGASDEETAQAQADVTMAAVGFDEDGKIVTVSIDVAQTRVAFDEDMQVTSDRDETVPTKKERGDDYGMLRVSEIEKEWYEQIAALEEWMIGKTVEEVMNLEVKVVDDAHQHVPDVPELESSVTITVESYLAAVEEAWENAVEADGAETVGLGVKTKINRSRDASDEEPAQAQVDTYMSATAFDADGNVVTTIIDNAQVRIAYDEDGQVAADMDAELQTKKERGDDYGMLRVSEIEKEWYEQIDALEEWMAGQSIEDIMNLNVKVVDDAHQHVPDVPELESSVTITVEGYLAVVEYASENAK